MHQDDVPLLKFSVGDVQLVFLCNHAPHDEALYSTFSHSFLCHIVETSARGSEVNGALTCKPSNLFVGVTNFPPLKRERSRGERSVIDGVIFKRHVVLRQEPSLVQRNLAGFSESSDGDFVSLQ